MAELRTGRRLDQPRSQARLRLNIDPDTFGRFTERVARFLGTGKYLFWQTLIVVVWIVLNLAAVSLRWDPYPFILLNLAFSTQAAYAAPLILLAQNRQDDRDRVALEQDRVQAERALADTEYLTREVAALRIALRDAATRDFIRSELRDLLEEMETKGLEVRAREDEGAPKGDPGPTW